MGACAGISRDCVRVVLIGLASPVELVVDVNGDGCSGCLHPTFCRMTGCHPLLTAPVCGSHGRLTSLSCELSLGDTARTSSFIYVFQIHPELPAPDHEPWTMKSLESASQGRQLWSRVVILVNTSVKETRRHRIGLMSFSRQSNSAIPTSELTSPL